MSIWAATACLLAAGASCEGESAAATVNGERITSDDLRLHQFLSELDGDGVSAGLDSGQQRLHRLGQLRNLIDQRLLLQRAASQGLLASDGEVAAAENRYVVQFPNREEFDAFLAGAAFDRGRLREELRRRLTVGKLLNKEVLSRVQITEARMREYYERNRAAFSVPEQQLHLAQILVTSGVDSPVPNLRNDDATDGASARRKIQRIRERLEAGEDFRQLAADYSEDRIYAATGGDMGFISQSALEEAHPDLLRAVAALQPGEFSPVVETEGEYRILHLIGVEPAGERDFDAPEVRDAIREVLANREEQLLRLALYEVERSRSSVRNYMAEEILAEYGVGR